MGEPQKTSVMGMLAIPLGTLGAVLGAFLGGYLYNLAWSKNIYMPLLVGGVVGFAAVGVARRGGVILALIATIVSVAGVVLARWFGEVSPRQEIGEYLDQYMTYVKTLSGFSLLLLIASPVLAFIIVIMTPAKQPKQQKSTP